MISIKETVIFVAGGALGAFATWMLVKDYYEKETEERVESVKAKFSDEKRYKDIAKNYSGDDDTIVTEHNTEDNIPTTNETTKVVDDRPYVISPDEFGEMDGYDQISLTYYADQILADDADNIIEEDDIDDVVGKDAVNHFGEYEDDSVFVRNDRLKCDYEILLDLRKYSEAIKVTKPWLFKDKEE